MEGVQRRESMGAVHVYMSCFPFLTVTVRLPEGILMPLKRDRKQ